MTIFLIIYMAGVLFNAIIARLIWSELKSEDVLERTRNAVVVLFVLASFVTWLFVLEGCIVSMYRRYFNKKGNIDDNGSNLH